MLRLCLSLYLSKSYYIDLDIKNFSRVFSRKAFYKFLSYSFITFESLCLVEKIASRCVKLY